MKSRYNEKDAAQLVARYADIPRDLALRIYTSRLIGTDPDLVLHGGGNTSVKIAGRNLMGEPVDLLYVKGSGWDLAAIEPEGFPAVDLAWARKLRALGELDDDEMVNQLRTHLTRATSPDPSVEALLHAFLPHRFVDHTHADAILILTNQRDGERMVREALGPKIAFLPYIMPGFPLAKAVAEHYERDPAVEAIVLGHHGIFTFGEDARTSYERMIAFVNRAEEYIEGKGGAIRPRAKVAGDATKARGATTSAPRVARTLQAIRGSLAFRGADGRLRRFILETRREPDLVAAAEGNRAKRIAAPGVLTPDHILRIKNEGISLADLPDEDGARANAIRSAVEDYRAHYASYFQENVRKKGVQRAMLDPAPRMFLAEGIGVIAAGFTRKAARVAADIAEHTVRAKLMADDIGEYTPLPPSDLFDMEYWSLEQKKLGKSTPPALEGQIAIVTGGGGAIALGIADRLLAAGALVALADIDPAKLATSTERLGAAHGADRIETLVMDVADEASVQEGFEELSRRAGGVDIVVPNAGVAHVAEIGDLALDDLRRVMEVNFIGTFTVLKAAAGVFRRQGTGGSVVVISTKNVFDPGASFGAYSASKAAAHQITKIAAMEFAPLGVRVNLVSPDAVFGDAEIPSGLWETVGPDRARSRGLTPEALRDYYRDRNLLKAEIRAEHVGNAVVFFASEATPTTGASLPVDGGLPGAFPR